MASLRLRLTLIATMALLTANRAAAECPRGELPAYAHNDYRNRHPLVDALNLGYRGVEADVFLVDGDLKVGHDRKAARKGATLETMYLQPLRALVKDCPRLTAGGAPFLLNIELKERSPEAFDSLVALVSRYRSLVQSADTTGRTSPVAIVLVGWHPPLTRWIAEEASLFSVQYRIRDVHRNGAVADLAVLDQRVGLVSLDYGKTIGRRWQGDTKRQRWLSTIHAAKLAVPRVRIRVYNVPADAAVYQSLFDTGVDLIGTKELSLTRPILMLWRSTNDSMTTAPSWLNGWIPGRWRGDRAFIPRLDAA